MCLFCERDRTEAEDVTARVYVLRLLALVEHPNALPRDAALRLGHEIIALTKPRSGVRRCEAIAAPEEAIAHLN